MFYSDEFKRQAVEFYHQHQNTLESTSEKFGVSTTSIKKWNKDLGNRKKAGKKRIFSPDQEQQILVLREQNPSVPWTEFTKIVRRKLDVHKVSHHTVRQVIRVYTGK